MVIIGNFFVQGGGSLAARKRKRQMKILQSNYAYYLKTLRFRLRKFILIYLKWHENLGRKIISNLKSGLKNSWEPVEKSNATER